jgi:hypothetical protein
MMHPKSAPSFFHQRSILNSGYQLVLQFPEIFLTKMSELMVVLEFVGTYLDWWRLLLEEYGPEIIHTKGIHNSVPMPYLGCTLAQTRMTMLIG